MVNVHPKRGRPTVTIIDEFICEVLPNLLAIPHRFRKSTTTPALRKGPEIGPCQCPRQARRRGPPLGVSGSANFTRAAFYQNLEAGPPCAGWAIGGRNRNLLRSLDPGRPSPPARRELTMIER